MNKPLLNKFLIVSLLLIWSIVGYKLISNFFGKDQSKAIDKLSVVNNLEKRTKKKETFVLPTIQRDPFLGSYSTPKKEVSPINSASMTFKNPKNPWPQIQYYGFVRGENSSNPLVLLKIDNNLQHIRKGNKIGGVYIKEIYRDSILILFGKEKRIFKKN